ncbi:Cytochrome bd2 [Klebsiella grimontii]|uniref:Cytochrome bd2 n=1 Tax=Klebsiella grimontii TaxID=2058152 RepID=A0A7H4P4D1_9ENTR|nr:Cytochrome bd2 [Klebsiella grimontii]
MIIDALAIPLTLMLIGLIFRGVAFEFRFNATPSHRPFWDRAFMGGSILATFTQGMVVGAVINGFAVSGRSFSGGMFDWLTPFTLFCGLGLCIAYALLGASWLVMKSENALHHNMRVTARGLLLRCWRQSSPSVSGRRWRSRPSPSAGLAYLTCSSCCRCRCWSRR